MEELINLLHSGGYSCVIANGDNIRTFTQRGVADLYDLLTQEPDFLKGASIADKVVGKGAAAPHDFGRYPGTAYRHHQFESVGFITKLGYKSPFRTRSTFYMES